MRRIHLVIGVAVLAAGFVASVALTFPRTASAWSWNQLPNGYSIFATNLGGGCNRVTVNGTLIGSTCDPGFQQALDAYVDSTICTVNPAAGQQAGECLPPPSTTTSTTTDAGTTTDPGTTTDATPPDGQDPTTTDSSGAQTVTTTVTVTVADPALSEQVTELQQRLAVANARIDELQSQTGATVLGEQKNEAPFTRGA